MKVLWRAGAALSLGFVVLMLAGFALQKVPGFGAGTDAVATALRTGADAKVYAGEYLATLAYVVLLVLLPLLARLVRGTGEGARWLAGAMVTTGTAYATVTLAAAFLPVSAAVWNTRHGGDAGAIAVVNDIHNFADVLTTALMGALILATAGAGLASGALPRWFSALSLPVGLACVAAGVPTTSLVDTVTLAWVAWFVVLAVVLVRRSAKLAPAAALVPAGALV